MARGAPARSLHPDELRQHLRTPRTPRLASIRHARRAAAARADPGGLHARRVRLQWPPHVLPRDGWGRACSSGIAWGGRFSLRLRPRGRRGACAWIRPRSDRPHSGRVGRYDCGHVRHATAAGAPQRPAWPSVRRLPRLTRRASRAIPPDRTFRVGARRPAVRLRTGDCYEDPTHLCVGRCRDDARDARPGPVDIDCQY
jgi:hypothetical protein